MKNFILLLLAICVAACSKQEGFESEVLVSQPTYGNDVSVVSVVDGKILKTSTRSQFDDETLALAFPTQWAYDNFKKRLSGMTKVQKIEYVKNLGVKTLKDLEIIADEELEKIDSLAASNDEFWQMYEQYKEKYVGLLYPDSEDKNNLTLYAPDGDGIEPFIANQDGVYVVGNEVVKANLHPISRTYSLKSTVGNEINSGSWSLPAIPEKTFCFSLNITEWNQIQIRYYTRKTMWHGGSKDDPHRDYYVKYNLNNITYLFTGPYGQTISSSAPAPIYSFYQPRHGVDEIMGQPYNNAIHVTGYTRLWTDLTVEHDADGNVATEVVGNTTIPKCLDSKAHYINIDLIPLSR